MKWSLSGAPGRAALIAAGAIALFSCSLATSADDASELEQVRAKVAEEFDEIEPEHVRPSPVDGWYTIHKGAIVAYISGDGRYLLQGELIDLVDQVNLTERVRNEARVEMLASVPEERTIVFAPEETRHSVSVFTDIDCIYCRRFHKQIEEYLANGIEVHYFLYPRNGPASESWVKAERVWCADDRNQALTLAKLDRDFESRSCDASVVHSHYALGQDVGLRGTPAIVLEDGTLVSGYLSPADLSDALASLE